MTQINELQRNKHNINIHKYVTFFLNKEEYGVAINKVREIIGIMDITPVPNTPKYIRGVLNLRGKVIPVLDLRLKFNMDFKEYTERTSIIVMEINVNDRKTLIGTIVDNVSEVLSITQDNIEDTPNFGTQVNTEIISGIAMVSNHVKILLDIDKVLTKEDIHIVNNVNDSMNKDIINE